jgi:hypothetical protein
MIPAVMLGTAMGRPLKATSRRVIMNKPIASQFLGYLLFGLSPFASAATILSSPVQFALPTTLIDFEFFPGGGTINYNDGTIADQWRNRGVLISDDTPFDGASAYSGTFSITPHSGTHAIADSDGSTVAGFVGFNFVVPGTNIGMTVAEAGLWVQNGDEPSDITFYDSNGAKIETITPLAGDSFAGLRAPEGIASVRITDAGYYMVDDLQFSIIPEPSSLALFAALAFMLNRRGTSTGCSKRLAIDHSRIAASVPAS